jgi:lysyl-tRNA synthetase class 2
MGKATFLDLRDGSGRIQAYFNKGQIGPERHELVKDFDLGDFVGVKGALFKTHTGEITVNVSDFTMLAKSLEPLPEKWH